MTSPPHRRRPRLSQERLRRVRELLAEEGMESARSERIPRLPAGPQPLSFAQERLWFLCRMRPESPVFHVPAAYRIRGPLDTAALERALVALTRRHAALRTRFASDQGRPRQEVLDAPVVELSVDPLAALAPAQREEEALRRARASTRAPFDLERAPLARFLVLRLADEQHLLVITVHHIVSEVQSIGILASDLADLYAAELAGESAQLFPLELTFGDFAAWQRTRVASAEVSAHLPYWREHLSGHLNALELPTDRPRPAVQSFAGAVRSRPLPAALARRLHAHAARTGQTLFAPLVAAYATLLARYGAAREVLIGVPVTERDRAELDGLVGFFVNTLVLRCDLAGDPGFQTLCERLTEELFAARSHQDVPFEHLVALFAPDRDLSRSPLFQVAFLLQYASEGGAARLALGAGAAMHALDPLAVHTATSKFDLALIAFADGDELSLAFEYASDLFDAPSIDRMLEHVELLLEQGLAEPERALSTLELLSTGERALLERWNATDAPRDPTRLVHELCAQHAARDPLAPAVVDGDFTLAYGELDRRANRLAHRLRSLGVGPDVPVAIATERCWEMVVAILAVLKAGGAYLPLDLSYPAERLAFFLRDSGAPVVLTRAALRELLPPHEGTTLCVDSEWSALGALPDSAPAPLAAPSGLAYVIYTSGSTGVPKGVAVEHSGLSNLTAWHARAYTVTPADRATHLAGLAFDAAVWELWPYLCSGASLYLVPDEVRLAPARLYAFLAQRRITLAFLPTPLAEALLREPPPAGLALRAMLTGGDKLHAAPAQALPFALVNHYGPTENSVVATACVVAPGTLGAPPIGHPIDNVRVHLYDAAGRRVPIGVPGELHIAGASLARGYHRRPELSAERFVADPQGREQRLYATGDLARWRADGELEFLGRRDGQVKVRGFRIELGEIEALLARHPDVRACACALQSRTQGDRLVGYVVADADASDDELSGFLRERLPDFMCPSVFVRLPALPLTPNGKLDRQALPMPADDSLPQAFVAPEGELEERIAAVWGEVLGRPGIDAHANFFDVGGHSLLMAQVHAMLCERLGHELTVVELFQYPTISSLATHLAQSGGDDEAAAEGEGRAAGRLARLKRRRSRKVER